ncbi:hypothetical protein DUT91_22415 [Phyllobacterium salinisoli]|uniref:Uncharacterized protein n=1 Tax=Phyllobacterium salinisoli TaxID=1899321 RepID=A0A368JXJ5_9HYPH|nr:hypothetical protein DUT91_22415 [Phyllobacterium salinisoli]
MMPHWSGASHVSGLHEAAHMAAGPDEVRGSGANQDRTAAYSTGGSSTCASMNTIWRRERRERTFPHLASVSTAMKSWTPRS